MSDTRALKLLPVLSACLCMLLAGCKGGGSSSDPTFSVGGTVSGITAGNSLVLSNNGVETLTVSVDGAFTFPTALGYGKGYSVLILANPIGEICSIAGASSGIITFSSVSNVAITCRPTTATVTTLAGTAHATGTADGAGLLATFNFPVDIAADTAGNLYVSDSVNHTIRKISSSGVVTTFAGTPGLTGSANGKPGSFSLPTGLTVDASGNVYVVDTGNDTIRKIDTSGNVSTIAGTAGVAGSVDGTGTAATFNFPAGIAIDTSGNLFVTDRGNHTIRKIDTAGAVTTFAGVAGFSGASDGTGTNALFHSPLGIAIDASNNLYVADGSNAIRRIDPNAVVTTGVGVAGTIGAADGIGTAASFGNLSGITVDTQGNVYVTDAGNNTIRKIAPDLTVTTIAGIVGSPGSNDNNSPTDTKAGSARFNNPTGIAVDSAGNLYVADYNNQLIRKITP